MVVLNVWSALEMEPALLPASRATQELIPVKVLFPHCRVFPVSHICLVCVIFYQRCLRLRNEPICFSSTFHSLPLKHVSQMLLEWHSLIITNKHVSINFSVLPRYHQQIMHRIEIIFIIIIYIANKIKWKEIVMLPHTYFFW